MRRSFFTVSLLLTLTVLISLMTIFSVKMIKMEREQGVRAQHEKYENKLRLALWQLETSALTIYNDCLAELSAPSAKKTFTVKTTILDNRNIFTQDEQGVIQLKFDTAHSSDAEILLQQLCESCHTGEALSIADISESLASATNDSELGASAWGDNDYRARASNSLKQKNATQILSSNASYQLIAEEEIDNLKPAKQESNPYQAYWIENKLYFLRNLGSKIEAVLLDHREIERQLLQEQPGLKITPTLHPCIKAENAHFSIIPAEELPFTKNALVTLPYTLNLPTPTAPKLNLYIIRNLSLTWASLILSILLAGGFILSLWTLSKRRSEFVSAVTHELRTPLTSFQLYSEMLRDGLVPNQEKRQSYLDTLHRESKRLSHLVENVLSYSRLERGAISKSEITLEQLLPPILDRLKSRAQQSSAILKIEQETSPSSTILTDPTAVEQILFNLVDNACKYGIDTSKTITLESKESSRNILFTVSDQGPGITPQERRTLFTPFHKTVKSAADTQQPGVGLGLSIAKRQAKLLGGDLILNNGPGASFTLSLKK